MQTLEPLLSEHAFFAGLHPADLSLLAGCASNVRFESGQMIFREGDPANQFFLIRHGRVALEIFSHNRGPVSIQTLAEGDVLGWSWMVAPFVWRFDAKALELTRALALDAECLRRKCDADPRLGYELLKRVVQVMTERLQATRLQLLDVYGKQD